MSCTQRGCGVVLLVCALLGLAGCMRASFYGRDEHDQGWAGDHRTADHDLEPRDAASLLDLSEASVVDAADVDTMAHDAMARDAMARDAMAHDAMARDAMALPTGWVRIVKGGFTMGSPTSELCRSSAEVQHQVTLSRDFAMQATEVTREQFQQRMGYEPSVLPACGSTCPVNSISWYEAAAYCNALSVEEGLPRCFSCSGSGASVVCLEEAAYAAGQIYACPGYRLPTEAEWEYAYRAGSSETFYSGPLTSCTQANAAADGIAWYLANAGGTSHPVGLKTPNDWGLYDLAGNVEEWVYDWYGAYGTAAVIDPWGAATGTVRVLRGGAYGGEAARIRAAERYIGHSLDSHMSDVGFRCVRSL